MADEDLINLTATQAAAEIASGALSAESYARACLTRIDALDGKPRAVLFGAAVHGTTLGADNYQLCGDYAGFAQAYLQERYPKAQTMFLIGCAGDAPFRLSREDRLRLVPYPLVEARVA